MKKNKKGVLLYNRFLLDDNKLSEIMHHNHLWNISDNLMFSVRDFIEDGVNKKLWRGVKNQILNGNS